MGWYQLLWVLLFSAVSVRAATPDICVSMTQYNDNYLSTLRNHLADEAQSRRLQILFRNAQNNPELEKGLIASFVSQQCPLIVINPVNTADAMIQDLLNIIPRTIPVIFLNREPETILPPNTYYVGSDDYESGKLQITHLMEHSKPELRIGILMGDTNSGVARRRTAAATDFLKSFAGSQIVIASHAGFSRTMAEQQVSYWITQHLSVDAIISNNDEMALGALTALKKAGIAPASIKILGIDGTLDALDAIQSHELFASVFQNSSEQAKKTIELANQLINQQPIVAQKYYVPYELITHNNYQEYIRIQNGY